MNSDSNSNEMMHQIEQQLKALKIQLASEDEMFEKCLANWDGQFDEWKQQNKNHPDHKQFKVYENQVLDIRRRLLAVRISINFKLLF